MQEKYEESADFSRQVRYVRSDYFISFRKDVRRVGHYVQKSWKADEERWDFFRCVTENGTNNNSLKTGHFPVAKISLTQWLL